MLLTATTAARYMLTVCTAKMIPCDCGDRLGTFKTALWCMEKKKKRKRKPRLRGPLSTASVPVHPSAKTQVREPSRRAAATAAAATSCRQHGEKPPLPLPPTPCPTRLQAFPLNNDWGSERGGWRLHTPIHTTSASPLEVFRIMGVVADQRLISSHWYSRRRWFIH